MQVYAPPRGEIQIHFSDDYIAVVEKPAGLLSVPGKGAEKSDCLMSRLKDAFPTALNVHRLDMETSGLMVVALHPDAQRVLSRAFEVRQVSKVYEAVVLGQVGKMEGTIDLPIVVDWPNRPRQIVDRENGKPSLTSWRVVSRNEVSSRLELRPKTGRSHQLRVHMDAIGHPILGDSLYGTDRSRAASSRLLLHARELEFDHPSSSEKLHFLSKTPF